MGMPLSGARKYFVICLFHLNTRLRVHRVVKIFIWEIRTRITQSARFKKMLIEKCLKSISRIPQRVHHKLRKSAFLVHGRPSCQAFFENKNIIPGRFEYKFHWCFRAICTHFRGVIQNSGGDTSSMSVRIVSFSWQNCHVWSKNAPPREITPCQTF